MAKRVINQELVRLAANRRDRFNEFIDSPDLKVTSYTGPIRDPWDSVYVVSAQLTKPAIDSHKERVDLRYKLGGRYAPGLVVDLPLMVAGMSYGALSWNAKLAIHNSLNTLARDHHMKLFYNTGEGGVLDHELHDRNYFLMVQVASGRFNVTLESLLKADAIEIKIGQGAKPGMGGQLPGLKVTEDIAGKRRIPPGVPAYSPARNMDIVGPEDLFAKIQELRLATMGRIPIGVKISATDVYNDAIIASRMADFITVDGMSGGTGAAPEIAQGYMGIPTLPSIVEARMGIDRMASQLFRNLRQVDQSVDYEEVSLISSGGIIFPNEIYTALCLGADMVSVGTAIELAMGCTSCFRCHEACPQYITREPEIGAAALDIDAASAGIVKYLLNTKKALELIYAANGHYIGNSSSPIELRTTDISVHETTGIPIPGRNVTAHVGDYYETNGGCGIAAIIPSERKLEDILARRSTPLPVNLMLIDMLESQQMRGPDSAGFAFYYYQDIPDSRFRLKLRLRSEDIHKVESALRLCSDGVIEKKPETPAGYRSGFEIFEFILTSEVTRLITGLDELSAMRDVALINFGRFSDIIKDVGTVDRVVELYGVRDYDKILYGIGHVRTATMSSVNPVTAHPFCTSVLPDITVVHNGEITNNPRLRRRLQVMGYPFFAPTDTEVIAAYVGERLRQGCSLQEACEEFVQKADGPYTFLLATPAGVAFVKDRYAMRPAMSGFNPEKGFYAVATDLVALNRVGATSERAVLGNGGVKIYPTVRRQ